MKIVNLLEFSLNEPIKIDENEKIIDGKYDANKSSSSESISTEENANSNDKNNENKADTYKVIPFFYHKLPKSTDILAQKLREEARTLFLQKRSKELLDNNELKTLWTILQKNYTQPSINNEHFINYDDYLRVVKIAGDKFKFE